MIALPGGMGAYGAWLCDEGRGRRKEGMDEDDEGVRRCQGDVKACVRRTLRRPET